MGFLNEMIGDFWSDIFSTCSSFGDRVAGVLMLGVLFILVVPLSVLAYMAVNSVAIKEMTNEKRVVVSKSFSPAHTNTTYLLVGRVTVSQTTHVPDTYFLCFDFGGNVACDDVKKEVYDVAEKGDSFHVSYRVDRLDGKHIIKQIQ